MLHRPTEAEKQHALKELLAESEITDYLMTDGYPELFGVNYTTPALDIYAAAHLLVDKPIVIRYSDENHYSLIILRPCSDC
jgi:hypothetical protein